MISIVIPACNEEAVIGRTLAAITAHGAAQMDGAEIVVVANGCSDATAHVARGFGAQVRVIETAEAGKPHALNLGDQVARGFPRIYADADVIITLPAIRALADRLDRGDVLATAPCPKVDLTDCSLAVRAFYAIRARMPSSKEGIGGSGVYAISEKGRKRFDAFPDLIADDGYVRLMFAPHERETLRNVYSTVFPPRRLRELIAVRARVHAGNVELRKSYPTIWTTSGENNGPALARLLRNPVLWPQLFIYILVTIVARCKARTHGATWARDDTSRGVVPPMPERRDDTRVI